MAYKRTKEIPVIILTIITQKSSPEYYDTKDFCVIIFESKPFPLSSPLTSVGVRFFFPTERFLFHKFNNKVVLIFFF